MDGIKNALTRKLGPLPVWAWGGLLVAVIAIFLVWKRSHGGGSAAVGGSGGTAPTDWTAVSADPGLIPTQPASQASVAPGGPASGLPVGTTLTNTGGSSSVGSFATVRSSTTPLTPVIPASNAHAIKSGPLAGVVPQGPSPRAHPKIIGGRPGGTTPLGTTQLTPEGLSPQGAQANLHGRERS